MTGEGERRMIMIRMRDGHDYNDSIYDVDGDGDYGNDGDANIDDMMVMMLIVKIMW